MKPPRWRILLPVALLVTVLAPVLRVFPGGGWLPDPWLLLLLWAVPGWDFFPARRGAVFALLLGGLRASVSAVSPFACWAGLGLALPVRREAYRRLTEDRFAARFAVGFLAALPLSVLDLRAAAGIGSSLPGIEVAARAAGVGLLWALAGGPATWRPREGEEVPAA